MSAIGTYFKKIAAVFYKERVEYQPTFQGELNYQCGMILSYASFLMAFSWLAYIPVDMELYPHEPGIIILRIGLCVIGLTVFVLHWSNKYTQHSLLMLSISGAYFNIATGLITAFTKGDSVYIGGYLFVTTMTAVIPIRRRVALSMLLCSLSTFMTVGFIKGMSFTSIHERYSLNDLISAFVVSAIFVILMDRVRFQSWQNTRKIVEQREELEKAMANVKQLSGLLPICAHCKQIRNDGGYWQELDKYVGDHSLVEFSHSLCPQCVQKLYPELADEILNK